MSSENPLRVDVGASQNLARPIRVTFDVGRDGERPMYDLDRDQTRFLVHQLQVELARTTNTMRPTMRSSNSGG
ncbi:hypothetical protein [Embleya sp. NBC_00896]|uniref:hypothetical protein n=1 Tax=Embleya sp. NBC_00896 TaxID=2975961 RepID=UPI002F908EC9|nr:hypothetical protein OG928_35600 [Embleya sp. NBC_00896]